MSSLSFIVISLIIFDITVLNEELLLYVLINPIKILNEFLIFSWKIISKLLAFISFVFIISFSEELFFL